LERARALLDDGWRTNEPERIKEARAEAERAAEIAHGGGVDELRRQAEALQEEVAARLARAERNRALLLALLDVAAPQETRAYKSDGAGVAMPLPQPSVEEQFAAAFRRWGLDLDGTAEAEVVARLGDEPEALRQGAVAGLDAWMLERLRKKHPEGEWRRLYRLAERLDESEQRRQLRTLLVEGGAPRTEAVAGLAGVWPPWPALWQLARGEQWRRLRALQGEIDPTTAPVLTLLLLAQASAQAGDAAGAEHLLRRAAAARPDEVALLDTLGKLLERQGPARLPEAIGCYRAARALRPRLGVALAKALSQAGQAAEGEAVLRDLLRQQPNNPALYFYLGIPLYTQGKLGEAVTAYRRAIELKKDFAEAYCGLGAALHVQKQPDEAAAALRRAIELQPGYALAHNNLGNALYRQGKREEAIAAYRRAIALQPDLAGAYYNLGSPLRELKRLEEATAALHQAIALQPDDAASYDNLGITLLELRKPGEAVAAFRQAIALRPDDALAYNNLGNALKDQGKLEEAVAAWHRATALQPDLFGPYHNLGLALAKQRKWGEAAAAWRRAIELKPENAEAYHNFGAVLYAQGKLDEAVTAFRKAIDLRPDYAEAYYNLGVARYDQGRLEEAVIAFRRAIALKEDFAEAYNNLGNALAKQGKLADAVAAYRRAIALKPDDAEAYFNLGDALERQKELGEAAAAYRKAIALRGDYAAAYTNLGIVLASQGKRDEAVAAFRKVIDLQPTDAVAYANLGIALYEQKKLDEAAAAFRRAIALKPDYAWAYANLGVVLRDQKKLGEAVAAFRRADQLLPNHPAICDNLRRVEGLLRLEQKLTACLAGKERPGTPREGVALGAFCGHFRERYHAALGFYTDAFRADPTLADDLQAGHRYNAARCAALAAAGRGQDADALAERERPELRRQAGTWLGADLEAWRLRILDGNPRDRADGAAVLRHWQGDAALVGVRHPWSLLRLPADERRPWQKLWADVDELLQKASKAGM
jgi:tetratricopeptide (TPR) repeat protein